MADPPDQDMESNYSEPEIVQNNPGHHVSMASKQFFTIDDIPYHK